MPVTPAEHEPPIATIRRRYEAVRRATESLVDGLEPEDMVVQSMEDVSPTKWHLAHTSWFFETFVLRPHLEDYREVDPRYAFLFNSYYVNAGERHCRAQRGYISRPTVAEVMAYRQHVDAAMSELFDRIGERALAEIEPLVTLGLNHEQQHQELMVTDIKHVFGVNPLRPVYRPAMASDGERAAPPPSEWRAFEGGLHRIGFDGGGGFSYDNESPAHTVYLEPFRIASRPVTNGEYLAFIEDDGYSRADLWLSLGWATVQEHGWTEPFYWERHESGWKVFTLNGLRDLNPSEPACHLSYFEADAYARWAGARLPTEAEWEIAARGRPIEGNLAESGRFHPAAAGGATDGSDLLQMYGDVWEWTASPYTPYPGYRPPPGAIGEYNGKFMCNQYVLRGGSCATPGSHIRRTYRNFFPPDTTWQFSGLRLANEG